MVEAAIQAVTASKGSDISPALTPEVTAALSVVKKDAPGEYAGLRHRLKKQGVPVGVLDGEVARADEQRQKLLHVDAADAAISWLGGRESVIFYKGQFWLWRQELGYWVHLESDEPIKEAIQAVLPKAQISGGEVGSILSVLKTRIHSEVGIQALGDKRVTVCLKNNVLVLRDVSFSEGMKTGFWDVVAHDRAFGHTSCLPVAWNEGAACPNFEKFLDDIFAVDDIPDDADDDIKAKKRCDDADAEAKKRVIIEMIGLSVLQVTDLERFVVLYGPTASNGKSTIINLLRALVGKDNAASMTISQMGERFNIAKLEGKLILTVPEVNRGERLPDAVIKAITSGDVIQGENKGKDPFDFKPYATTWIAGNYLPYLGDLSPAVLDKRCLLISMNRSFKGESADRGLLDRLTEEVEGILFKCLTMFAGMRALAREGSTFNLDAAGELRPTAFFDCLAEDPPSSIAAKAIWRRDSDPVQLFADESLEANAGGLVESAELFSTWKRWRESQGVKLELDQRGLTRRLLAIFPGLRTGDGARVGKVRCVAGLKIKAA